jgi:hypothetical protein
MSTRDRDRLAAIFARLDSNFAGERAAAALLAGRFLRKHGLTWQEAAAELAKQQR